MVETQKKKLEQPFFSRTRLVVSSIATLNESGVVRVGDWNLTRTGNNINFQLIGRWDSPLSIGIDILNNEAVLELIKTKSPFIRKKLLIDLQSSL